MIARAISKINGILCLGFIVLQVPVFQTISPRKDALIDCSMTQLKYLNPKLSVVMEDGVIPLVRQLS